MWFLNKPSRRIKDCSANSNVIALDVNMANLSATSFLAYTLCDIHSFASLFPHCRYFTSFRYRCKVKNLPMVVSLGLTYYFARFIFFARITMRGKREANE